jgi:hypothetical protein
MVLSYDCEVDKDPKHRMVALIRPLRGVPSEGQEIIRAHDNFSACYLPAYGEIMSESYVTDNDTSPRFLGKLRAYCFLD